MTLRCELEPFDAADTAAYIASRIRTAGGDPSRIFSREAVTLIHQCSLGIPRTISVICDNALISGMALRQQRVTQAIVLEVCRDLHLASSEELHSSTLPTVAQDERRDSPPPADAHDQHALSFMGRAGRIFTR